MRRRLLLAAPAFALPARAQPAWPSRGVSIVVPFAPGGSTDVVARIFQAKLGEVLGRPVVIDNRGGASGAIGGGEAARACLATVAALARLPDSAH